MSIIAILFLIGVFMILAGVLGRVGSGTMAEIDSNVAATIGLMITYAFLLINFTSISELTKIFESICGGIPFISEITDYGSLTNVFHAAPLEAAVAFLDVVCLSTIINMLSLLPHTSGSATGKFMVRMFTGIILALISLMLFNFIVKESEIYRYIVSSLGAVITMLSIGSIPLSLVSLITNRNTSGIGFLAILFIFSKSKVVGILRDSFFKAIVYVVGIYVLETEFGTIANSMSRFATVTVAFAPAVIMIIGMIIMIKSVFKK